MHQRTVPIVPRTFDAKVTFPSDILLSVGGRWGIGLLDEVVYCGNIEGGRV